MAYVEKRCSALKGRAQGLCSAACELLVQSDLAKRGYEITVPISPTAKHDMHVKLPSVGWTGIQVKAGRLRARTNTLSFGGGRSYGRPIESPILALVYLPENRIEYFAGSEPLPKELT